MTFSMVFRRAALLGLALSALACDVVSFLSDPKPIFEQLWNLPSSKTAISVAKIVPSNVSIYITPGSSPPDTSAFLLSISNTVFARRVGDDCPSCQTLNGTNAVKPQFILAAGNSSSLGTDVLSGALLSSAVVNYSVVNNLSFDPIRVRALSDPNQGYMIVLVHSGSLVLGRDSLNGATTAFPAGSTMARSIQLTSGTIVGQLTVDLTINSPSGDHVEFINANGTVNTTGAYSNVRAGNVRVNVASKTVNNQPDTVDLKGLDKTITDHVVSASFEMGFDNPWPVSGNLNINFDYAPPLSVAKSTPLPAGIIPAATQVESIALTGAEMKLLFGNEVILNMNGLVDSPTPLTVTPRQSVSITNRLILKIQTGG
jgi:hypothetical protein